MTLYTERASDLVRQQMRELDERIVLGTNDQVILWWFPEDDSTWLQIVHSASPDEFCLFRIQPGLEREAFEHPYTMAWLHESELVESSVAS